MARTLVVYGTEAHRGGSVAGRLADALHTRGHSVELLHGEDVPAGLPLDVFDGVLVVAPVHEGRYPPSVVDFVRAGRRAFASVPTAFASVSETGGPWDDVVSDADRRDAAAFLADVDWVPDATVFVTGSGVGPRGLLKRLLVRSLGRRQDGAPAVAETDDGSTPSDSRGDGDRTVRGYATPTELEEFVETFDALLDRRPAMARVDERSIE